MTTDHTPPPVPDPRSSTRPGTRLDPPDPTPPDRAPLPDYLTRIQWPEHPLPHAWRTEAGLHACNAPFIDPVTGRLSGYCEVPVAGWRRWFRPAGTHRGDHQITWANRAARGR